MAGLDYNKLAIQSYMTSVNIYPQLAKRIFKWRTRMMKFKMNFQNGSDDLLCPLGCPEIDFQEKILECSVIKSHIPKLETTHIQYRDIFSTNISKIKETVELLDTAFTKREKLIDLRQSLQNFNLSIL